MPRAGWLALGAVVGALLWAVMPGVVVCLLGGVAALVLAGVVRRGHAGRGAAISVAAVGAGLVLLRGAAGLAGTAPPAADVAATVGHHVAHVVSVGSSDGGQQRVVVELEPPERPERVYAWLPRYPAVSALDRIAFDADLQAPTGDDSFSQYLARAGITYSARARSFQRLGASDTPLAELERVRRGAADLLARAVPQPQAGLATGLLVGLRDQLARDVAADFRAAGLSHIVAISGSHLALLAALAGSLLGRLSRRRRSIAVLALIWFYSLLAGGGPAVFRAALMASVVIGARESGRAGQARGALALTAAVMLFVDPTVVGDVGFQLSLAATAGLLIWSGTFGALLKRRLPRRTPAVLVDGLGMSLAAQLATQPLVLLHFGQLSLVSPLANLLAAPLVAPAMLASAAALAVAGLASAGLPDVILAPFGLAATLALGGLIAVAHVCASLPLASLALPPPFDVLAAVLAAALVAPLLRWRPVAPPDPAGAIADGLSQRAASSPAARRRRRSLAALACATGAVLVSALVASAQPDGRLHMTVLDVGQGDSILLQGPAGGRILIDTGPDPNRLLALLDARLPAWDRRLDVVVITHPHEDHVAGLALLLDRYRVGEIAEPGMIGLGPGDAAFRRRLSELGRATRLLAAGDRLYLDGIELDVLWPHAGQVPLHPTDGGTQVNNVSVVLEMQYGERRFLLGGDIEQQIDPQLLAQALPAGGARFDVLKVAHHGSATATTSAFLDRVNPAVAIISAGWANPYGHPAPDTVARLEATGANVYRTDLDGSVAISTDGHDLTAQAAGGRPLPTIPTAYVAPGPGWCPIPNPAYPTRLAFDVSRGGG
jgi:competence protein ComEC